MKATRECDQQERMLRALLIIDGLCLINDFSTTPVASEEPMNPAEQFHYDVYAIAHVAAGGCGNPHEYWLDLIDERAKMLKEHNTMDLEKILGQFKDGTRPGKKDGKGSHGSGEGK